MSTPKSKFHDFHLRLCRYASENLAEHLDDVVFSETDRQKYGALIEYVRKSADDGLVEDMSELLLNDEEFRRLSAWARSLESSTSEMPVRPPRKWYAVPAYHKLALRCVSEIKHALPGWERTWSSDSARFMEEFESPNLSVADGIETCRRWANEVIRYQKELFREDLIPRPFGEFPTPTTRDMAVVVSKIENTRKKLTNAASAGDNKKYVELMKEALADCSSIDDVKSLASHYHIDPYVLSMRWAIGEQGDASGDELFKRIVAHNRDNPSESKKPANRQLCFLAASILTHLNEHASRAKSDWRTEKK